MVKKQTTSVLPHLPHGMAMAQVPVNEKPIMPGQKSLPPDWRNTENNQLVPGAHSNRQRSVSKQGIPWTDRTSKLQLPSNSEPPPVFSSTPSKVAVIRNARESRTSKQIQRMESGINPVELLSTRLESWRLAVKNLVSLFKKIVLVENRTSKGLVGASKEIELPFKNSNGQFLENGGIQDVWASLRDYTMQHGILHHQSASYIQGAVIPALRALKSDIKTMILQIEKDKDLKSNFIYDSRIQVNRLIYRLDKTIEADQRSPQAADQYQDPFLLNLNIIHAIRDLCDHENRLHDNILNLQHETAIFEGKIIESIRHILRNYHEYRIENKIEDEDFIGNVTETFNQISPATEWNNFVQRNKYNLVMENSVYKTEDSVEYPSQRSRFVRASKIGPLQLRTGITKGWTEGIYILTPAGFLHGYKTPKHFQTNPLRPSFSIFVPKSTVSCNGDTFEINCNKDKRVNLGTNSYVFRAPTRGENQAWYSYLYGITEEFKTVPLLEKTETNYTSTPIHRDLPPLPPSVLPIEHTEERRAIEASSVPQIENRSSERLGQHDVSQQQNHNQQYQGNTNDQYYGESDQSIVNQRGHSDTITGDDQLNNITASHQTTSGNQNTGLNNQGNDNNLGNQTNDSGIQPGDYASGSQTGNYASAIRSEEGNHATDLNQKYDPTPNTQKTDNYQNPGNFNTTKNDRAIDDTSGNYSDIDTSDEDLHATKSGLLNQRLSPTTSLGEEHKAIEDTFHDRYSSSPTDPHYESRTHQSKITDTLDDDDSYTHSCLGYTSNKQGGPGL